MKWIKIREGRWKFVEDDDERPEAKLKKKKFGSFSIGYKPKWASTFDRMNPDPMAMDAEGERVALDAMMDEKEVELKFDKKARKWEKGRKKAWRENVTFKKRKESEHQAKIEGAKKTALQFLTRKVKERKGK